MKVAFITTVLNEEKNILPYLNSVLSQSRRPDEIVIVDGGSKDKTAEIIKDRISKIRSDSLRNKIKVLIKNGNRSVGRNEAIKNAESEIIACSDAGCVLDKNWLRNITKPFKSKSVEVVAGYYKGIANSIFEKSLLPYVLVMPDKVKRDNFLPAGRSVAFRKDVWVKVGGFPQKLSSNEDYVFARKLKKIGAKIVFRKNAIVNYMPRKNVIEAFKMFFSYAKGDSEAGILRPKVVLIFFRYVILLWLLIYVYFFKLFFILETIFYILVLYILWSIWKNYRYVRDREGFLYLPLIQIASDIAVISGTSWGFLKGLWDTQKKP